MRLRTTFLATVLAIPLLAGAGIAATTTGLDPAATWNSAPEEPAAAPALIHPADLVDARRAAGEAGTQAGFLSSAATELEQGTGELKSGAEQLQGGINQARDGSQQLRQGLVELQAGTGQLGQGATEIADGVGEAVDQIVGLEAVRGQLLEAIDRVDKELKESRDPKSKAMREELGGFKSQVETIQLDATMTEQLDKLKKGSRDLANQLNVPGYAYHDGIYSATKGAQQLANGLEELSGGAGQAQAGVNQLDEGAKKIHQMAEQNKEKVASIQRALPAVPVPPQAAEQQTPPEKAPMLAPLHAMLLAAIVLIGGALAGWAFGAYRLWGASRVIAAVLLGSLALTILSGTLMIILAASLSPAAIALGLGSLFLGAFASTAVATWLRRVLGVVPSGVLLGVGSLVQVGFIGWVWKSVATSPIASTWQIISHLMPLHYNTAALVSATNDGSRPALWLGMGVLALLGLGACGLLADSHRVASVGKHTQAGGPMYPEVHPEG